MSWSRNSRTLDLSSRTDEPARPSAVERRRRTSFRAAMLASMLESVGAAISWTGLPVYAVGISGDSRLFTWLFTAQTIAGLVAALIAGAITDRFPLRAIVFVTAGATSAGLLMIYGTLTVTRIWPFVVLSLVIQLAGTIASNAIRVWFTFLAPPGQLSKWTGRRGTWLTTAKLAGTSAGPIVYTALGKNGLILNAVMILVAASIYAYAVKLEQSRQASQRREASLIREIVAGPRLLRTNATLAKLVAVQAGAGLLGVPLTAVALRLLQGTPGVTAVHYSAFWAVGFAGAFCANLAIGKGWIPDRKPVRIIGAALAMATMTLAFVANISSPLIFICGFLAVVVARTVLNVMLFVTLVPAADNGYRGRVVAISDLANDGASLGALLLFTSVNQAALPTTTTIYVLLVALASFLVIRALGSRSHTETEAS